MSSRRTEKDTFSNKGMSSWNNPHHVVSESPLPADAREGGDPSEEEDGTGYEHIGDTGGHNTLADGEGYPHAVCGACGGYHPPSSPCIGDMSKPYPGTLPTPGIPPAGSAPRRTLPTSDELCEEIASLQDMINRAKARIKGLTKISNLIIKLDGQGLLPAVDPAELAGG
jgi:hypothetical protein